MNLKPETLTTFIIYCLLLPAIGIYFFRQTKKIEDYLLGGRRLGVWVTALSAQASDMSGWLLMGLPGAVYLAGISESWIAIGLFIGTVFNWLFVSSRLCVYTRKTDSITLPCFFEDRFRDPTGLLRTMSALIILIFFTIYASSGIVASGKLFEVMFGIDYKFAVIAGSFVIVFYTFFGGYLAVCWTDLIQGILMFFALVTVPVAACQSAGGFEVVRDALVTKGLSTSLFNTSDSSTISFISIISTAAWGLGYFGQPHILTRFMSVKSVSVLPRAMGIAFVWVAISLAGAVATGLFGTAMYDHLNTGDHEKIFIYMIGELFHPLVGGVLLAAIMSAIMSTIDSQLLVSSSALAEDFYKKVIRKDATDKEVVRVGRACVAGISVIALMTAWNENNTVLGLVAYAWGGLGAAFGPLVLFALFSKKTTWQSALAGMTVGTIVMVLWKQAGLGGLMYEIVPGFLSNVLIMALINLFNPQKDEAVLKEFDEVIKERHLGTEVQRIKE